MEYLKLVVPLLVFAMLIHVTNSGSSGKGKHYKGQTDFKRTNSHEQSKGSSKHSKSLKEWGKSKGPRMSSKAECVGLPPSPINGCVTRIPDDVVTYSCKKGYVLEGENNSTCQNDGSWTNVNTTTCRADCAVLPQSPSNGKVTGSQYLQDDVVTYSCDEGYVLEGKDKSTCQNDRSWTNVNSTTCMADCAVLPQSPSNGKVTGSQYLQDDVVTYSCDVGYVLEGKDKSTCQNDRSWTNVNSTTCRADCAGLPQSPSNGKVTGSQYLQDDVVTYSCDEGYVLEGENKSTCQNDRSWTNENSTTCRADCAGLPQSPSNGKVTGSQYLQDDVVTYNCDEGYVLEGENKSTCQNDRSWTNENSTTCRADCAGLPQSPSNGKVTGSQHLQDDVVTYSCDEGYVLEGENKSTCQNDRSWTNENSTTCRADCAGLPQSPSNGKVTGSQYLQDDVVTYSCDGGYVLEGKDKSTCQNDRSWTNENSTTCRADCAGLPQSPSNGKVTGSQYLQDDVVTYSCDEGYVLEGENKSTCQNDRSWTNENSTTCRADCTGLPPPPSNGNVAGTTYLQDDVATYSCKDGFLLDGEGNSTCQKDGQWDNINSTECLEICGEQLQAGKQRNILVSHANYYGNQDYDLDMLCNSSIEARPGYTVNLIFKAMEIENEVDMAIGNNYCWDKLHVYDFRHDAYQTLGYTCGSTVPSAISSTGQYLLVGFETDNSFNFKGFSAEYKEVETAVQAIN